MWEFREGDSFAKFQNSVAHAIQSGVISTITAARLLGRLPQREEAVLDATVAIARAEAAEAAARDFAQALRQISGRLDEAGCGATDPTGEHHIALNALSAHPDFAESSKPDEEER